MQTDSNFATTTELFKALGDPVRWSIVQQIAAADELACSRLEDTLPISKPTISYHTKILAQAGIIAVRKEGRNFFYSLRREALQSASAALWEIAPVPRPVTVGERGVTEATPIRRRPRPRTRFADGNVAVGQDFSLTTW